MRRITSDRRRWADLALNWTWRTEAGRAAWVRYCQAAPARLAFIDYLYANTADWNAFQRWLTR